MLSRTLPSLLRTRCCPLLARASVMRASPATLAARPSALLHRHCTTPPGQAAGKATVPDEAPKADTEATKPAEPAAPEGAGLMNTGADSGPGKGLALEDDEKDLPPLAFEPGVAGAAQKGVSAIVIVFGAAAFGACAWGISTALFPSASSTDVIFSEALEKVSQDPNVAFALGTPMRGYGSGGRGEGRRNAKERWEVSEGGNEYSVVRFHVAGSQGSALVQAQVPKQRRRGEFRYIIVELPRRRLVHARPVTSEDGPAPPMPLVAPWPRSRSGHRSPDPVAFPMLHPCCCAGPGQSSRGGRRGRRGRRRGSGAGRGCGAGCCGIECRRLRGACAVELGCASRWEDARGRMLPAGWGHTAVCCVLRGGALCSARFTRFGSLPPLL